MNFCEKITHSFFLCEQTLLIDFAKRFVHANLSSNQSVNNTEPAPGLFSVVCERKEDLIAVRSQLFHWVNCERLKCGLSHTEVISGLSMYTLDSLGENFCSTLANNDADLIGSEHAKNFAQPYLDAPTQEKLMKCLLLYFGYQGSDTQPLAKQLLALIDLQWPADYSFFQLLQETQSQEHDRNVQEITERSLREILAVYQAGIHVFGNFSRFQNLVLNFLEPNFIHLLNQKIDGVAGCESFVIPKRFLASNILWFSAPEYSTYSSSSIPEKEMLSEHINSISFYKPGDFQSHIVDSFRNVIIASQKLFKQNSQFFWHARTCFATNMHPQVQLQTTHISYLFANNRHAASADLRDLLQPQKILQTDPLENELEHPLVLLADFDPGRFREINSDASGAYAITESDIAKYFKDYSTLSNQNKSHSLSNESDVETVRETVHNTLHEQFEIFSELLQVIDEEQDFLVNLMRRYQLQPEHTHLKSSSFSKYFAAQMQNLFTRWCIDQSVTIGASHPVSMVDKALAFIASASLPTQIIAIGPAHATTLPSFNVKILNDAFYLMRKKGVALGLPASDTTYRGFWSWLTQQNISLAFWLLEANDIEAFPAYLAPKNESRIASLSLPIGGRFLTSLDKQLGVDRLHLVPDWLTRFQRKSSVQGMPRVSITEFENYVQCPLRFFLGDILSIEEFSADFSRGDALDAGNKTHRVAELFLQGLRQIFLSSNLFVCEPLLANMAQLLQEEDFFLSLNSEEWLLKFVFTMKNEIQPYCIFLLKFQTKLCVIFIY